MRESERGVSSSSSNAEDGTALYSADIAGEMGWSQRHNGAAARPEIDKP